MPRIRTSLTVDRELKSQAETICAEMGLTLSSVYTLLLKAIVNTRSLPFKIRASDTFYSNKNQAVLMESIRELDEGRGQEHELIDVYRMPDDNTLEISQCRNHYDD